MKAARNLVFALHASLLISGCFGFAHDEVFVGPYRLVAVDADEDMSICFSLADGSCVGDGLPGPTVFAAGFDDKYLVAAVHPPGAEGGPDRSTTHYYYIVRSSTSGTLPRNGTVGPLNEAQFTGETTRLHLPNFTRTFNHLK